jgi:hypothetical protein
MAFPYQKISIILVSDLHPRTRDILARRFGLEAEEPETLEAIGQRHGITRERVRQIVEDGISQVKTIAQEGKEREKLASIFQELSMILKDTGHLKRQDLLVNELSSNKDTNYVVFLLHLAENLYRQKETEHIHPFWASKKEVYEESIRALEALLGRLEARKEALSFEDLAGEYAKVGGEKINTRTLASLLEVSKRIAQADNGKWGLRSWPEVHPKGMRDKAYVVLKKVEKPLHFEEVARLIADLSQTSAGQNKRAVLPQTVHNELIKDPRFVLVGRGTYALAEWGYKPGTVKEVMMDILKEHGSGMPKEELIAKTLNQRQVKESTILLNLQDKTCFQRDGGVYFCIAT